MNEGTPVARQSVAFSRRHGADDGGARELGRTRPGSSTPSARVGGADYTWCFGIAYQGAYASKRTHRSNSVTCGDTGSARVNFFVGTSLKKKLRRPYGPVLVLRAPTTTRTASSA